MEPVEPIEWRRMFVGREGELERLQQAWARTSRTDGKKPEPQCVVLLAESGLGKTRLVQEFYRWLRRTQDPHTEAASQGYWPDAFTTDSESLEVNPTFPEDAKGSGEIPWLWWGIRFSRPDRRNEIGSRCGLIDYRPSLYSHTGPIAAVRGLKEVGRGTFWKKVGIGITVGGAVGGAVGATVGTLAGLAFAAKDLFSLRSDAKTQAELRDQAERTPRAAQAAEQTDVEDVALNYFRTVLDTRNNEAETVPVVLFLDDAQWADPVTLRFLSQLMDEARTHHWPLLVICTHWEVEWNESIRGHKVDAKQPNSLAGLLAVRQHMDQDYVTWIQIHLLVPIHDLSSVATTALPGLSDLQVNLILERAGGNPLLLREILDFFGRREHYFTSEDSTCGLSETGEHELRTRRFNLHELIDDRFQSLDDAAKKSLACGSVQGRSFLTGVTIEALQFAKVKITAASAQSGLESAETPHAFIARHSEDGNFGINTFRQAAFQQIATEYLHSQPENLRKFREGTQVSLIRYLLDGEVEAAPFQEQMEAAVIARRILSPNDGEHDRARRAWCQSVARLAQLYRDRFMWDASWEAAAAWIEAAPNGWSLNDLNFDGQLMVARVLESSLKFDKALTIVHPLITTLNEYAGTAPDYVTLEHLSRAYLEAGDLQYRLGRHPDASLAYENGHATHNRMLQDFGSTPEDSFNATIFLDRIGLIKTAAGNIQEAAAAYRSSLEVIEAIIANGGVKDELATLRSLAVSLSKLAEQEAALGDVSTALHRHRRSLAIRRDLLERAVDRHAASQDIAMALDHVGDVEFQIGNGDEAIARYNESLEIRKELLEAEGLLPEHLEHLSISLEKIGRAHNLYGNHVKAIESHRESIALLEQIVSKFGETLRGRHVIAVSLEHLGDALWASGDMANAISTHLKCLAIREKILEESNLPEYRRCLCNTLDRLGDAKSEQEKADEAWTFHARGLEIREQLIQELGEAPDRLWELTLSLDHHARHDRVCGRIRAAIKRYEESRQIKQRVIDDFGETPLRLRNLANSWSRLGEIYFDEEEWKDSLDHYAKSLSLFERYRDLYPATPENLRDVMVTANRIGDISFFMERFGIATGYYRSGVDTSEEIVERYGERPDTLWDVAYSYKRLAIAESDVGNSNEAIAASRASLDAYQNIVDKFPPTEESLTNLIIALECTSHYQEKGLGVAPVEGRETELRVRELKRSSFGASADELEDLLLRYGAVATRLLDSGQRERAVQCFGQAYEISCELTELLGETKATLSNMSMALLSLAQTLQTPTTKLLTLTQECLSKQQTNGWISEQGRLASSLIANELARRERDQGDGE